MFFFNDTATPEIYPLSLHDALPIWTLAVVPPLVVPAHGVVVGDGPAGGQQRLAGGGLHLVPLRHEGVRTARRQHREVGGAPVRVDVGEAARDRASAADLGQIGRASCRERV